METFYPPGTAPAEFLPAYAQQFDTVAVDSACYRIPSKPVAGNWHARTPPGFLVAAKFPQAITHDKVLTDRREALAEFMRVINPPGAVNAAG